MEEFVKGMRVTPLENIDIEMVEVVNVPYNIDPKENVDCTALTRDHKPDDPSEAKRILDNNGRIDSFRLSGAAAAARGLLDGGFRA